MDRIYISTEADRLTVAAILVKNKYTVRQGSQRRPGTKSYDYFLECELNPGEAEKIAGKQEKEGGK